MAVQIQCPNPGCGKTGTVAGDRVGQYVRCAHCRTKFKVPVATLPESADTTDGVVSPDVRATPNPQAKGVSPAFSPSAHSMARTPKPTQDLPERIGRFYIRARLGAGAFGTVYRAFDPQLRREIALKVSHGDPSGDPKVGKRFVSEATAAARLRHPAIVPILEAGSDGTHPYIASVFIDGCTLARAIKAGPMDCRQAAQLVSDLADAVAYAHGQGIVHRDIKPANIMLEKSGQVYLMDFGLAHQQDARTRLTQDGAIVGTPSYMAPEQALGKSGDPLPASDQYSLGVVLYELVCGRTPFEGARAAALLYHVIHGTPPTPRSVNPSLPRELEAICMKTMAKRPGHRFASCQELADELARFARGEPVTARSLGAAASGWRWCRHNPVLATLSAVVAFLLVVMGVGIGFVANMRQPDAAVAQQEKAASETKVERPRPSMPATKPDPTSAKAAKVPENSKSPKIPDPIRVEVVQDVALAPPSNVRTLAGHYEPNKTGDQGILLQYDSDKSQWQRIDAKRSDVSTGRPLVSLPGYKSAVALKSGILLTLWGNAPEVWPFPPPVLESMVELHHHDQLDADLTLRRGRIVLRNTRSDRPARVRVRFDNPAMASFMVTWDLTLADRDTEVALERWGMVPPGEPFYKNPEDKMRTGPWADVALIVLKGRVQLKCDTRTDTLEAPPKRALMLWNSGSNITGPFKMPDIPEWSKTPLPSPKGMEKDLARSRVNFAHARDHLGTVLTANDVQVALDRALKSMDSVERVLVVRSFGAIDDLESLLLAVSDNDETHNDVRQCAILTLRNWINYSRDNDYRLYDALKDKYNTREAENIMSLLHGFSDQQLGKKETFETLIDYLTNPNPMIRELSAMYLYQFVPAGQKIGYSPVAGSPERERAQGEWIKLLRSGQIPPRPAKK